MAQLPDYITKTVPNPSSNRAPWYKNTAPSYAGIFLWVAFYQSISQGTIDRGGLGLCIFALAVAGILSYGLYYYVPAMLGMKTGYPLYVVGSSTFGTKGGYLMPGLLMGLLQVGWFAVATFLSTRFILNGFGSDAGPNTAVFAIVAVLWGYTMAWVGIKGLEYVAKVSLYLNIIPLLMILIVFFKTQPGLAQHTVTNPNGFITFTLLIQIVIGFFATAGAAGADFGQGSRDSRDVRMGGLVGIAFAVVVAGGLPLLAVAGARALNPSLVAAGSFTFEAVIGSMGGILATTMFFLFALASITPSCICAFIAANSFSTMIPNVPRMSSTMAAMTVAIILAITGVAGDLVGFFSIVGASFGPICGAMVADYLLSGKRWAGPREGINMAGYGAWGIGFLVGIIPFLPVSEAVKVYSQPAAIYSFFTGLIVYTVLAKAGLQPKAVKIEQPAPAKRSGARA